MINTVLQSINIYYLIVVIYALSVTILLLISFVLIKKAHKKNKSMNNHIKIISNQYEENEKFRMSLINDIKKKHQHELDVRDNIHAGQLKKIQQELRNQKDENREKALTKALAFHAEHGGTFALMMEFAEQIYKYYGRKSL